MCVFLFLGLLNHYLLPLKSVTLVVFQIPDGLLIHCKSLQNLSLHNNPISMDQFQLVIQ